MTIITLHHLFCSHCVNSSVIVLDLGIFFGSIAPSEKYLSPKQSPPISHNDLKKDGAQLLLSKWLWGWSRKPEGLASIPRGYIFFKLLPSVTMSNLVKSFKKCLSIPFDHAIISMLCQYFVPILFPSKDSQRELANVDYYHLHPIIPQKNKSTSPGAINTDTNSLCIYPCSWPLDFRF